MPVAYDFETLSLVYITGDGDIGFGACRGSVSIDALRISVLSSPMEIGADATGLPNSSDFATYVHFDSVRCLDVLIGVLGKIRESMVAAETKPTGWNPPDIA